MRHGQTDWNLAGKAQGRTDIELNDTGIEQARKAKEEINKCNIDLIFCSPLKRARKTAEIINEAINCQIISDERIIERGFGNVEGKTDDEWKKIFGDNTHAISNYYLNFNEQNIESMRDICERVWDLLDEIKEKYKDEFSYEYLVGLLNSKVYYLLHMEGLVEQLMHILMELMKMDMFKV